MLWGRGMNLHDEKWPFAVAFLLSLLGWHITQLTDEVRSAITVLYSVEIDEANRLYTVRLENASRKRSISDVRFLIQCEGSSACLDPTAPIFWERAAGSNVCDADGNRYVDLTAGFRVANLGHAHPRVVDAVVDQAERLLHSLGDAQPAAVKVALLSTE